LDVVYFIFPKIGHGRFFSHSACLRYHKSSLLAGTELHSVHVCSVRSVSIMYAGLAIHLGHFLHVPSRVLHDDEPHI
jgi:hypothetical protein